MPSRQSHEGSLDPVFVLGVLQSHAFQPINDSDLGEGYRVDVGQEGRAVSIGVFPKVSAVQVVSGTSILRLENVQRIRKSGEKLHVEAVQENEKVSIDISPQGVFSLRRQPLVAVGEVDPEPADVTDASIAEAPMKPEPAPARHRRTKPAEKPDNAVGGTRETHESSNDRITVRGRVGREAQFRTTQRRGVFIGSFPLGEHPDLEATIWHNVLVFGDRAEKLREKGLTRGQEIEVVGYVHEREITTGGKGSEGKGGRKTVREIYATAIRTTLRSGPDSSNSSGS